jgi:hypothetical protein
LTDCSYVLYSFALENFMSEAQRQAALLRKEKGTQARGWKRPLRTHCKNGHELTEENVYLRIRDGERACRICRNASTEEWWNKQSPERQEKRRLRKIAQATKWGKDNPDKFKMNQARQEWRPEVKARRKRFYEETKSQAWRKFSCLKSKAKSYNQNFTLTVEDYERLIVDKPCTYCGGALPVVGSGTDRQNNKLGYVAENIVPCCETCNEKKGRLEGLGLTYPRTVEILMEILGK